MKSDLPSVLFVCYANICRSPTAEAVFRAIAKAAGLDCKIDSEGTNQTKANLLPDKRSVQVANAKGCGFEVIGSRGVTEEDIINFDYIVPMDMKNYDNLMEIAPDKYKYKINLFRHYADENKRQRTI